MTMPRALPRFRRAVTLGLTTILLACGSGETGSTGDPSNIDDVEDTVPPGGGAPAPSAPSGCNALYSCQAMPGATEVRIPNECAKASDVFLSIVGPACAATVQPPCIQNISTSPASVWLLGTDTANNFRVGSFGSATMFEVTHNASGSDWYDISQNQGFDIGMTIVPPGGDVPYIVCKTQNCPGAYPLGDSACETSPCLQPNYDAGPTGGRFDLYLCNGWPGDARPAPHTNQNTPGPLACSYNQGACIPPGSPSCPSDPQNLPCKWAHPVPGQSNGSHGTCPLSCP